MRAWIVRRLAQEEALIETAELVSRIREALDERKAIDPVVLDVRGISSVTDYYVIASGSSPPHLKALSEAVEIPLKKTGTSVYRRSGTPESGWVAIDYFDAVIHILSPQARAYYALERLWGDAKVIE